jgi:hypothetical protein
MSDEWTPTTGGIRGMYAQGFEGAWQPFQGVITTPQLAREDFDRWLAEIFKVAARAERKKVVREIQLMQIKEIKVALEEGKHFPSSRNTTMRDCIDRINQKVN